VPCLKTRGSASPNIGARTCIEPTRRIAANIAKQFYFLACSKCLDGTPKPRPFPPRPGQSSQPTSSTSPQSYRSCRAMREIAIIAVVASFIGIWAAALVLLFLL
jgi:hypothetical protein